MKPKQKAKITDTHRIKIVKERSTYTFTELLTHMQQNLNKNKATKDRWGAGGGGGGKKRKNKAMEILPECRLTLRSKWK